MTFLPLLAWVWVFIINMLLLISAAPFFVGSTPLVLQAMSVVKSMRSSMAGLLAF
jgi:hypothetical protein